MSSADPGTDVPAGRILSCELPASPMVRDVSVSMQLHEIVWSSVLVDGDGTELRVHARRGVRADIEWTAVWLDEVPAEDVPGEIAGRFGVEPAAVRGIEQLIERAIELASIAVLAQGPTGVRAVEAEIRRALAEMNDAARGGGSRAGGEKS